SVRSTFTSFGSFFSFFATVSTRSFATISLRGRPASMTAYSNFGLTAAYMFDGKVHGVVVQTASAVEGSSTSGNSTKTDGSSTSLYPRPTSALESAVPPCAHHHTTL